MDAFNKVVNGANGLLHPCNRLGCDKAVRKAKQGVSKYCSKSCAAAVRSGAARKDRQFEAVTAAVPRVEIPAQNLVRDALHDNEAAAQVLLNFMMTAQGLSDELDDALTRAVIQLRRSARKTR